MKFGSAIDEKVSWCYLCLLVSLAGGPTYDLDKIKACIRAGTYWISGTALTDALTSGLDREDIVDCVLSLDEADFYKTMEATSKPGLHQDVYKPVYLGVRMYVKVQLDSAAVVISFKEA